MDERLKRQIGFIIEIDKIKAIFRKTKLFDGSRYENDSEHSWHLAVMAILLAEYANEKIDVPKVIKMVLVHDIVEIDAGDTLVYTKDKTDYKEKESKAAARIFGLLPGDQGMELKNLWEEFEEKKTPEAKFAFALDRLEPVMQNYHTQAHAWRNNSVSAEQVLKVNSRIGEGSGKLWEFAKGLIEECIEKGYVK